MSKAKSDGKRPDTARAANLLLDTLTTIRTDVNDLREKWNHERLWKHEITNRVHDLETWRDGAKSFDHALLEQRDSIEMLKERVDVNTDDLTAACNAMYKYHDRHQAYHAYLAVATLVNAAISLTALFMAWAR